MKYEYAPFRQLKLKRLTKVSVGKDVEEMELSCIAGGNGSGKNTVENSLTITLKVKTAFRMGENNSTLSN